MLLNWPIYGQTGGAERIVCEFSAALLAQGHSVTVVSGDKSQGFPIYSLDPRVKLIYFGDIPIPRFIKYLKSIFTWSIRKKERKVLRRFMKLELKSFQLKKAIQSLESDLIISYEPESTYIYFRAFNSLTPVITMFHSSPEFLISKILGAYYADHLNKFPSLDYYKVRRWFDIYIAQLRKSSVIQVLMPEFIKTIENLIPNIEIICIRNPVNQAKKMSNLNAHTIINIARVVPVKRQILIVEAFNLIKDRFPDWKIEIWGQTDADKSYTANLQSTIDKYGLENRIKLCGVTSNIDKKLDNSSILIMTSSVEGFCLGMVESMTKGLPVIGCNSCTAINTIIRDGENGFLCEDSPESIAKALERLMKSKTLRIKLGRQGHKDAKAYDPPIIWTQWNQLISKTINNNDLYDI